MANEATVRVSLTVRKGNVFYQSRPEAFLADVSVGKGPSPGVVTCNAGGTIVSLSELAQPGLCRLSNQSASGYIEYGVWDPETSVFYPFGEILPGESYVVRLSRNFGVEYAGTGTGTTADTNRLFVKGVDGATVVLVECFDT